MFQRIFVFQNFDESEGKKPDVIFLEISQEEETLRTMKVKLLCYQDWYKCVEIFLE